MQDLRLRYRITLVAGDTIYALKDELEKLTKLLAPEQEVVFEGVELVNDKTLAESGFSTDADNACVLKQLIVEGLDDKLSDEELASLNLARDWLKPENRSNFEKTAAFLFRACDTDKSGYIEAKEMPGLLKLLYRNSGLEKVLRPPGEYEIKQLAKQADAMSNPMGIQIDQLEWSLFMRKFLEEKLKIAN